MLSFFGRSKGFLRKNGFRAKQAWEKFRHGFKYRLTPDSQHLSRQIDRYYKHVGLDNSLTHTKYLLPEIAKLVGKEARLLLIGPCNMNEIGAFLDQGFTNLSAIDLVSQNKKYIREMDMHSLEFPDASFDLVYATGVLHCSHAPAQVGKEIARVLKDGGHLIAGVVVDYATDEVYRIDFKDVEGLLGIFPSPKPSVLMSVTEEPRTERNPHKSRFLKAILKFSKNPRA